jgi:glycosyltransferase involved in cell wall biosynthesis
VFIVSPGLGHVPRGFESFSRECFVALKGRPDVSVLLVKGAGDAADSERRVWTFRRDARLTRRIATLVRTDAYDIEQVVFAVGMLPLIAARRPDVVFFSDWLVGRTLMRCRRHTGQRFRLLFSNGLPAGPPYRFADHVQQLTQPALEFALSAGEPAERQTMLPLGLRIDPELRTLSDADLGALRRRLRLPERRRIVLSVAALNKWHKRLDYVVAEMARLPQQQRPHLVLLGHREDETAGVLAEATSRLGRDGFTARTVPLDDVRDFYRASDVFVLASTFEGMGRVFVEALSHGLPALAHDYAVPRFVLGDEGYFTDLRRPGALADLVSSISDSDLSLQSRRQRHRYAYDRFSWERLTPRYVELLHQLADRQRVLRPPPGAPV